MIVVYAQPKERFEKWMSMVPAGRMASTSELKGVSIHDRDVDFH